MFIARNVQFNDAKMIIQLLDGRTITTPISRFPSLSNASKEALNHWELLGEGEGIHWPDLDEDISIEKLVFGNTPIALRTQTIQGNCDCKAIQYTLKNIKNILNCHCTICRKLTGGAFASYVVVHENDYTIIQGEENLAAYHKDNTTAKKYFCKTCGSPMFNTNPTYGEIKIVYLGTLAEGHGLEPKVNLYYGNKLDWLETLFDATNLEGDRNRTEK